MPGWIDIKVVSDADDAAAHKPQPQTAAAPPRPDGRTISIGAGGVLAILAAAALVVAVAAVAWFVGFRDAGQSSMAGIVGEAVPMPASQFSAQAPAAGAAANAPAAPVQSSVDETESPGLEVPDSPSDDVARRLQSDQVVARVNGEPITEAMVEREVSIARVLYPLSQGVPVGSDETTLSRMRVDLLSSLVDERLLVQAAQDTGMSVDDAEVDKRVNDILIKTRLTEAELSDLLAGVGVSLDDLRTSLRSTLLAEQFVADSPAPENVITESPYSAWVSALQADADIEILTGSASSQVVKVGQPAPDFTLRDMDGETITLSDYRGNPVIVNFWATWCPPCRYEMPLLEQTYQTHKDAGLVVLAVDVQETADQVKAYRAEMNLTFPMPLDRGGAVATAYRVSGLPTSVFVDVDGVVTAIHRGALVEDTLQGYLDDLLDRGE